MSYKKQYDIIYIDNSTKNEVNSLLRTQDDFYSHNDKLYIKLGMRGYHEVKQITNISIKTTISDSFGTFWEHVGFWLWILSMGPILWLFDDKPSGGLAFLIWFTFPILVMCLCWLLDIIEKQSLNIEREYDELLNLCPDFSENLTNPNSHKTNYAPRDGNIKIHENFLEQSYQTHKESLVRKLTSDNSEKAKTNPTVRKAIDEIADMNMKADLSWVKESGATQEQQDEIVNNLEIQEQKKLANHVAYEGRISATDKRKLKTILGYNCMVCGKNMKDKYGDIGNGYIELHHKIPYANMGVNDTRTLNKDDFCVLCPDCHRMIHKLKDAGDLELLKTIIAIQNPNDKVSISEYTSQQKQDYDYFDDDDD